MFTDENKTVIIRTEAVAFRSIFWVCAEQVLARNSSSSDFSGDGFKWNTNQVYRELGRVLSHTALPVHGELAKGTSSRQNRNTLPRHQRAHHVLRALTVRSRSRRK